MRVKNRMRERERERGVNDSIYLLYLILFIRKKEKNGVNIIKNRRLLDFFGMSTYLGLFHTDRLGNRLHFTFIVTFLRSIF